MADRPLMMLSLPNSGSTWFAAQIAANTQYRRYFMEYFNPIRNHKHHDLLKTEFGCELACCYRNIISAGSHNIHAVIDAVWSDDYYNFTKEVFSPAKLEAFTRHFRCFVFVRNAADSFPPSRLRVMSFYEHAWQAYHDQGFQIEGETLLQKAHAAHALMTATMISDANRLNVPVLHWRELFEDQILEQKIELAIGDCNDQLIKGIQTTRLRRERFSVAAK